MSDLLSSPQFDRPASVEPSWLKSVLGTKLFEAPLAVAMIAATLNCSYAPPAKAALDVRTHLTAPDAGWLTALPLYNAPTNVPRADQRRNASYVVDRGPRLELRLHLTSPEWPAPLAALNLTGARDYVPAVQDPRLRSFLPPTGPRFLLGTFNTAPQNTPLAAALNLTDATDYGAVANAQGLTSYLVPTRPDTAIDSSPQDGWRFSAIPTNPPPTYPPGADQVRNSFLPIGPSRFAPDTAPAFAWLGALRIGNAALAVPSNDAGRNSYAPPRGPSLDVRTFLTAPTFSWQAAPLRIGTAVFSVAPDDAVRNSYLVAARALLDVRTASPNFVPTVLPTPAPTYPPAADLLRSYLVPSRAGFDARLLTAPGPAWIYKALPIVVVPTYPPGADLVRSYLVASRRPSLRFGTDDTAPDFSWLEMPLGLPTGGYVPPPTPGHRTLPTGRTAVVPTALRRPLFVPRGIQTVTIPPSLKKPWRKR
jgi:hypothetical protein